MFRAGLGNPVLLLVGLAMLSVLRVLPGIVRPARTFLLMGVAFLFLVIFAQIWHAVVDRAQTWVWWASGVVLGDPPRRLRALREAPQRGAEADRREQALAVAEGVRLQPRAGSRDNGVAGPPRVGGVLAGTARGSSPESLRRDAGRLGPGVPPGRRG